jgi:hypothetical protein
MATVGLEGLISGRQNGVQVSGKINASSKLYIIPRMRESADNPYGKAFCRIQRVSHATFIVQGPDLKLPRLRFP